MYSTFNKHLAKWRCFQGLRDCLTWLCTIKLQLRCANCRGSKKVSKLAVMPIQSAPSTRCSARIRGPSKSPSPSLGLVLSGRIMESCGRLHRHHQPRCVTLEASQAVFHPQFCCSHLYMVSYKEIGEEGCSPRNKNSTLPYIIDRGSEHAGEALRNLNRLAQSTTLRLSIRLSIGNATDATPTLHEIWNPSHTRLATQIP